MEKQSEKTSAHNEEERRELVEEPVEDIYDEEVDGVEDNQSIGSNESDGEKQTGDAPRFSSPDAAKMRKAALPVEIQKLLDLLPIDIVYNAIIEMMKSRCQSLRGSPPESLEKFKEMWHSATLSQMYTFRRNQNNFGATRFDLARVPKELLEYIDAHGVVDLLQMLIDVVQIQGYEAHQTLQSYREDQSKKVTQHQFDAAQGSCNELRKQYHDFVTLFQVCTGTWKPRKNRFVQQRDGPDRSSFQRDRSGFQRDRSSFHQGQTRSGPPPTRGFPSTRGFPPTRGFPAARGSPATRGPMRQERSENSDRYERQDSAPRQDRYDRYDRSERRPYQPGTYQMQNRAPQQQREGGDFRPNSAPRGNSQSRRY